MLEPASAAFSSNVMPVPPEPAPAAGGPVRPAPGGSAAVAAARGRGAAARGEGAAVRGDRAGRSRGARPRVTALLHAVARTQESTTKIAAMAAGSGPGAPRALLSRRHMHDIVGFTAGGMALARMVPGQRTDPRTAPRRW